MKSFSKLFEIIYNKYSKITIHGTKTNKKNISLLALSNFLNVSRGKVQAWQKGQWPAAEDLVIIANKLGFSHKWLLTGEGEPEKTPDTPAMEIVAKPFRTILSTNAEKSEIKDEKSAMKHEIMLLKNNITDLRSHIATQNELIFTYKELLKKR